MFVKNCGNVKMALFLNDGCCDMCLIDEYNTYNEHGEKCYYLVTKVKF